MKRVILALSAAVAVAVPVTLATAGAASATSSAFTASQAVSNRDDSGANGGNWALDQFTRVITLHGDGIVANSFCPGITIGACHKLSGNVRDNGTFTTQPGNPVPGAGSLNGGAVPDIGATVTGPMHGGISYTTFYANVGITSFSAGNAPATVSGDSPSTGQWPEQFAPAGTQFWDTSGNTGGSEYLAGNGSWTYTEHPGANTACPNESSQWVDGSPTWGGVPADGNILAQGSSSC